MLGNQCWKTSYDNFEKLFSNILGKMFMNDKKGFTLIEVLVVIGIISILSGIAIPNAVAWRSSAQLSSTAREIVVDLQRAKMEAIKRNRNVEAVFTTGKGSSSTINDLITNQILGGNSYSAGIEVTIAEGERFIFNSQGLPVDKNNKPVGHDDDAKTELQINLTNEKRDITVVVSLAGNIRIQS
jgi:prepilin-type N-terminal cleavage/methylation domain-containing protein